jgi:hypothetical protein
MKKLLVSILMFFWYEAAFAAIGTTVGSLTLMQNFETISVVCSFMNDDNNNMSAVVEYKPTTGSTWVTAFTPYIDRLSEVWSGESRSTATNPNYKQIRTAIFGLSSNISYDVKVTVVDADGVLGINPITGTVVTWNHDNPIMKGNTYYVNSSTGDDNNSGLSGSPWKTITKANGSVSAGDTIRLTGSFSGFNWTSNGSSTNYIKIESADYNNPANISSLTTIAASYNWITHINFNASVRTTGAEYLVFNHNTIRNYSGSYIGNFGMVSGSVLGNLIEHNTIYNDSIPSNESGTGIYINAAVAGRFVIRYNTIHTAYDGIGGSGNFSFNAGPPESSDIHNNEIYDCYDDGIESEGGNINIKIWSNTIRDAARPGYGRVGIAVAPIEIGPAFILNNVIYNAAHGFKLGFGKGKGYFINNTIWNVDQAGASTSGGSAANLEFYNNIFYVTLNYVLEGDSYSTGWISNNNNFDSNGVSSLKWLGERISRSTLLESFGQETNGKNVPSNLVAPPYDIRLNESSGLINAGKFFPGIAFINYGKNIGAYPDGNIAIRPPGGLKFIP